MIDRAFFAGSCIGGRAHLIQLQVDLSSGPIGRAFKDHVLEKMADAANAGRFVARSSFDEKTKTGRVSLVIALGMNLQAIS